MAFKYNGDATIGVSLTVETPKPLDNRTVVADLSELYSIPEKYAYQGMTVANIDNGNIYMLVDKAYISDRRGWKASYESILIITCTEAEYKEWLSNTTVDFKPIDPNKTYLHSETYYYIYEDSMDDDQFYLSAAWGKLIEESLKLKALNTTVVQIRNDLDDIVKNYATLEELKRDYVLKSSLDLTDPDSFLSITLGKYYTKLETDDKFVTKESLRGEGMEGDDFVFVTLNLYEKDLQLIKEELDKTLKLDGEGSLDSITVGLIKSPVVEGENLLVVDVKSDGLYIGDDTIAMSSLVPNLVTLTEEEYLKLVEEGKLQEDTYYYVYDILNSSQVYITKEYLDLNYHTTNQYLSWVATNYYSRILVDVLISKLELADKTFLTTELAASTYTTKTELSEFITTVETDYVTKESLRGDSPDAGDDFIFVTQNKYSEDLAAVALKFTTKSLDTEVIQTLGITILKIEEKEVQLGITEDGITPIVTEPIVASSVNLGTYNNRLTSGDKEFAFVEEVPKLVCLPLPDYDKLVENNKTEKDTYYCTYGEKDIQDTGYVTSEFLYEKFYTKEEVDELIRLATVELQKKIDELQPGSSNITVDDNEQLIIS